MKIAKCIICIAGTDYLDPKLELTKSRADALPISGKRNAKKLKAWLEKQGVSKVSLIEIDV